MCNLSNYYFAIYSYCSLTLNRWKPEIKNPNFWYNKKRTKEITLNNMYERLTMIYDEEDYQGLNNTEKLGLNVYDAKTVRQFLKQ